MGIFEGIRKGMKQPELGDNGVGNVLELLGSNKDSFEINEHELKVRSIII